MLRGRLLTSPSLIGRERESLGNSWLDSAWDDHDTALALCGQEPGGQNPSSQIPLSPVDKRKRRGPEALGVAC
jgi:hypothetical protein